MGETSGPGHVTTSYYTTVYVQMCKKVTEKSLANCLVEPAGRK